MALSTSPTARWTSLSSSAGTPSGRCRPSVFGMYALRTGFARYAPRLSRSARSRRLPPQVLPVVLPRLAIHPRCRIALEREIGIEQPLQVIDVVQKRREPLFPILSCCFAYPLERAGRVIPALRPERVALQQVSLGQPPSLHRLRRRCSGFVRRLRRYYAAVRLPASVRHQRVSLDFPMRSAFAIADDGRDAPGF